MVSPSGSLASVDICRMRVAQLTSAGVPQQGAFGWVTDVVETAKIGTTNDEINEQIRRNGCGTIITHIPKIVTVKGSSFSVDLTKWERSLIKLMCGGTTFSSAGAVGGYRAPAAADGQPLPVCIELWAKAWDASAQAITAISTPNPSYHCYVLPMVQCSLSEFTLANGDTIYTVTGEGSENPNITADGPWNDWPAWIAGGGGFTSAFGEFDDATMPAAATTVQTVPATS